MNPFVRSAIAALIIATLVLAFTIRIVAPVVAPSIPLIVGRPDFEETRQFTRPAVPTLRLVNTDGLIHVVTHKGNEILGSAAIRAFLKSGASKDDLAQYVASLVQVSEEDGAVVITTEPRQRPDGFDIHVVYHLTVPEGTNVDIASNNGNMWVDGGCGNVTVKGRNADIEIKRPNGLVVAESINGRIRVIDAPEGGRIHTENGNVYADVRGGRLEAATTNGVIYASLLEPVQGGVPLEGARLTSQNGGVTLFMNDRLSASIAARTERGTVVSYIPIDTSGGIQQRRVLEGHIGSGGARIELDTLNGNIRIARSG